MSIWDDGADDKDDDDDGAGVFLMVLPMVASRP
jgi:hypothetical protein